MAANNGKCGVGVAYNARIGGQVPFIITIFNLLFVSFIDEESDSVDYTPSWPNSNACINKV